MRQKVLVIDDEKDFCFFIKENLELACDCEVACAFNGEDGLALAEQKKPNIIILDLLMPKMDGRTVLDKLKSSPSTSDIPVILLTAIDSAEARLRVPGLPKDAYLTKPVTLEDLKNAMSKALRLDK